MKLKIAIRLLGNRAPDLDVESLRKWKSEIWEIHDNRIDTLPLNGDSDLDSWGYSDDALSNNAPPVKDADITLYVLNVPVEANYYFRRLSNNTACLSLFEIADVLRSHNIPVENAVLRMAYSSALIHSRRGALPPMSEVPTLAHHETKGCIFDMAGIKSDIAFSTDKPILCDACRIAANNERVTNETLQIYSTELLHIRKRLYFRISDRIKRHPIRALAISTVFALALGIISSIVANIIYDEMKTGHPETRQDGSPATGLPSGQP